MKNNILKLTLIVAIGSLALVGCSEEKTAETTTATESHEGHNHGTEPANTAYYCPMKCEGEKTYTEKGSCPTCGMDLVEKK